MSTIEVNKFVGGFLTALLLALGFNFIAQLIYGGGEHGHVPEPAFVVEAPAATGAAPAAPAAVAPIAERLAQADAGAGEKIFKKCAACHNIDPAAGNKIGPNLWGVIGANRARHADFAYSDALKALGGAWDFATLDKFLTDPQGFVPGTKMAFPGLASPADRADVIRYLRDQSDSPLPLPEAAAAPAPAAPAAEETAPEAAVAEPATEAVAAAPAASAATDLEAGAKLFKKCAACHNDSADAGHKIGPNLWGVVGAPVARHQDFKYSSALSGLGGNWDQAKLDAFLTDPKSYAPGTKMAFPGLDDAADRAAVIAYLASQGG